MIIHTYYKYLFPILFLSLVSLIFPLNALAVTETLTTVTASYAVDTAASSPQYISGADLTPLNAVDNSTITTSQFGTSINTSTANFVFRFSPGYTLPDNEEFKSMNLKLVYKTNVGTLSTHYVVVKYFNNSGVRQTCVSQHNLAIPSSSGSYLTDQFDISGCRDGSKVNNIEVYYYAAASLQPVNTSFDQAVVFIEHGDKSSSSSSSSSSSISSPTSNFVKPIDVSRDGGLITRGNGIVSISFGKNSLPYEANITTEVITDPKVIKPSRLVGNIQKLNVFAAFNGYPLPKFNPALLYLSYPSCSGRPVIRVSTNGKTWKNLFTVRTLHSTNTVAAVIRSPGYYAVSCL